MCRPEGKPGENSSRFNWPTEGFKKYSTGIFTCSGVNQRFLFLCPLSAKNKCNYLSLSLSVCLEKKKEYIKNKVSVSLAEDQLVALVANSEWECTRFPFIRRFAHRRGRCFLWMSVMLMRQKKPTMPWKTCLNKRTFTVNCRLCLSLDLPRFQLLFSLCLL